MKKIILKSLYYFLAFCSRIYLWRTKPTIVGVTGSVGKTTCRMILAEVLQKIQIQDTNVSKWKEKKWKRDIRIYSSPKNFNTELGLVFSIFCVEEYSPGIKSLLKLSLHIFIQALFARKKYDVLIAEYGIDVPHDMEFLLKIATPDITVLTKLWSVHSENFPWGLEELWQQKWLLLLAAKHKVYFNAQDIFSQEHKNLLSKPYEEIFTDESSSDLSLINDMLIQSWSYNKKNISINLLGKEEQEYVNLWCMIAKDIWVDAKGINYDFRVELLPGRFWVFQSGESICIDSTYNSNPEALIKLIENTKAIHKKMYPQHKLGFVLWDMREIGGLSESAHRELVPLVKGADLILTVGPQMYQHFIPELTASSYTWDIHSSLSSREIGKYLKKYLSIHSDEKYLILFKWSQNTIFIEEALSEILTSPQQRSLIRQSESWKKKKDTFFMNL